MVYYAWDKDYGNDGRTTSIDLLLRWLLSDGNFVQWHTGKDEQGQPVSKEALMEELRKDMLRFGIAHRSTSDLQKKLWSILQSFEDAYLWMKKHGKPLLKNGKEQEAREKVKEICEYYFDLEPKLKKYIPFRTLRSQTQNKSVVNEMPSTRPVANEKSPAQPVANDRPSARPVPSEKPTVHPVVANDKPTVRPTSTPKVVVRPQSDLPRRPQVIRHSPPTTTTHNDGKKRREDDVSEVPDSRRLHIHRETGHSGRMVAENIDIGQHIQLETLRIQEKIHNDKTELRKRKLALKERETEADIEIKKKRAVIETVYAQIDMISALNSMNVPPAQIMEHLKQLSLQ